MNVNSWLAWMMRLSAVFLLSWLVLKGISLIVGLAIAVIWLWYVRRKCPATFWREMLGLLVLFWVSCWLLFLFSPPSSVHSLFYKNLTANQELWAIVMQAMVHSLMLAFLGSLMACAFGLIIGGVLGLAKGKVLALLNPLLQTFMAIPILLYFLLGLVVLPTGSSSIVVIFAFCLWLEPARMIQTRLVSLKSEPFVHLAKVQGKTAWHVFVQEILPNIRPVVWVSFMVVFLNAILLESILGYLGLGLEPGTPSLGKLIELGSKSWPEAPLLLLVPIAIELAWLFSLRGVLRSLDKKQQPLVIA